MTGFTAEKHDSFITPTGDGRILMELSGKELSRGEADASSFPSGGLRATFEARGYTAWDPTSYAFVKDKTLCIPTIFCSYTGETLDKKTPLLRSMHALDQQCIRILRLFGNTEAQHVIASGGRGAGVFPYRQGGLSTSREDLRLCGRTLFGAKPPKGQELDDHYYGAIKPRVAAFMQELDEELWKLGVLAKTEHNEVAPAQHETGPRLLQRQHRLRPQPADHGADEEAWPSATAWSACSTKSPLPGSTAAASTTTGLCTPTLARIC